MIFKLPISQPARKNVGIGVGAKLIVGSSEGTGVVGTNVGTGLGLAWMPNRPVVSYTEW